MQPNNITVDIEGRCIISDDLGNIHLNKTNSLHCQNLSRALTRGLAYENNAHIHRIAFGNGGTYLDAAYNTIKNKPNNGLLPDLAGYKSRLYNEIYSEIISANENLGSGLGTYAASDPTNGSGVISNELYDEEPPYSQVILTCVINKNEPSGQYLTQISNDASNTTFEFDEIALFVGGADSDLATSGYQSITISTPNLFVNSGLMRNRSYDLSLNINGAVKQYSIYTGPLKADNNINFAEMIVILRQYVKDISIDMSDSAATALFGYLVFKGKTVSTNSLLSTISIVEDHDNLNWLFNNIPLMTSINEPVAGVVASVANNRNNPSQELSRMLTHLILDRPIKKSADRIFIVKYILNIRIRGK